FWVILVSFWGVLGHSGVLGCFAVLLGCFGSFWFILGHFGLFWGGFGWFWGGFELFWGGFGASFGRFGGFWIILGSCWVILGCFGVVLGRFGVVLVHLVSFWFIWGCFGSFWVISGWFWVILGWFWVISGWFGVILVLFWGSFGVFWGGVELLWVVLGHFGVVLGGFGAFWGILGGFGRSLTTCPPVPGFVGCFVDSGSPPALSGASGTSTRLTVPLCLRFCRGRGYELAGLEAGYACFCGHAGDLRRGQRAGTAECDQVCFGKASQLCGGDGRLAVYHAWVGACRANSSAPSGVVYSPGFPDDYGPDADCAWRLGGGTGTPTGTGAALEVTFRLFDIRDPNDRLTLRDARSRRLLAQFDGRRPPPPARALLLPTEALELTFRSDTLRHAQGFALTYRREWGGTGGHW
uniref:WSC domain-containing protein n=1 Tax=Anas zonorhyncha TaxID=75864 RepID=A0A8B9UNC2_9AVES